MKLEHIAVWVDDLDQLREFYCKFFDASCGDKYFNPAKGFTSYFLLFAGGGCRIELMNRSGIGANEGTRWEKKGLAHLAICVGGKDKVDALTERLRGDGHTIAGEPRTSGDGYYESAVLDPEGNYVEIVACG